MRILPHLITQNSQKILIEDFLFFVGNFQKSLIDLLPVLFRYALSQLGNAMEHAMPAGSCCQDYPAPGKADVRGLHDLIGLTFL